MRTMNNLRQFAIAMQQYHNANSCMPPSVLIGPDGKTPYSWRVAILPFIEEQELYDAYNFDEPWDGPNNIELLERMPRIFRHPTMPDDTTTSAYYPLVGPETVFSEFIDGNESFEGDNSISGGGERGTGSVQIRPPSNKGVGYSWIVDGTAYTLMLLEAKRDIPWTKPEDIPYDVDQPIPELGGHFDDGFYSIMCYGTVRFWPEDTSESLLRAMISKHGLERIDFNTLEVAND